MIRYAIRCEKDHEFEAWFRSGADYDRMVGDGEVPCPMCGTKVVEKAIMAPAVRSPKKAEARSRKGPACRGRPSRAGVARSHQGTAPEDRREFGLCRRSLRGRSAEDPLPARQSRTASTARRVARMPRRSPKRESSSSRSRFCRTTGTSRWPGSSSPAPIAESACRWPKDTGSAATT